MLIYNSRKEFQGIDENDLSALGFSTLSELRDESADFADLFVRTPGFIHNFQYVHWIDYITYGGSSGTPKAIIHTKEKDFWCNLNITSAYLTDDASSKAYLVNIANLRELSKKELASITSDIAAKPKPETIKARPAPFVDPSIHENVRKSIAKQNSVLNGAVKQPKEEVLSQVTPQKPIQQQVPIQEEAPLDVSEAFEDEEIVQETPQEVVEAPKDTPPKEVVPQQQGYNSEYIYDPQVASNELGLPVDLIEEFIEDFITQAKEFKDGLYEALNDEDINNVRILSHKLKGVAANLRVENAFEVLTIVNTSDDLKVIRENLGYLYIIISKLNGEEIDELDHLSIQEEEEEDDFVLDFKDIDAPSTPTEQTQQIEYNDKEEEEDDLLLSIQSDDTQDISHVEYDKDAVAVQMGVDITTFNELFHDYINDSKELCKLIDSAIDADDASLWQNEAIKLKGMSNNMKIDLFTNELETLLETSERYQAAEAMTKIISTISNLEA